MTLQGILMIGLEWKGKQYKLSYKLYSYKMIPFDMNGKIPNYYRRNSNLKAFKM